MFGDTRSQAGRLTAVMSCVALLTLTACVPIQPLASQPPSPLQPEAPIAQGSDGWDSPACLALAPAWVVEVVRSQAPLGEAVAAGEAAMGAPPVAHSVAGRPEWQGGPTHIRLYAPQGLVERAWLGHLAATVPPTFGDLLACAGEPEGVTATTSPTFSPSTQVLLFFPEEGLTAAAFVPVADGADPIVTPDLPLVVTDLVAPGTLESMLQAQSVALGAGPDDSSIAITLAMMQPWPGSLEAIEFVTFPSEAPTSTP